MSDVRSVRRALVASFALLAVLVVVTGYIAVRALQDTIAKKDEVALAYANELATIERLRFRAENVVAISRGVLLTGDREFPEAYDEAKALLLAELWSLQGVAEEPQLLENVTHVADWYLHLTDITIKHRTTVPDARAILPLHEEVLRPARDELEASLNALVVGTERTLRAEFQQTERRAKYVQRVLIIISAFELLFGVLIAHFAVRQLVRRFAAEEGALHVAETEATAREEILNVVAHDLRSPLAAIMLQTQNMQRRGIEDGRIRRSVASIDQAATRMRHLIEEVLEVARIDASKMQLKRDRCVVAELLSNTQALFSAQAENKGVALSMPLPPRSLSVDADCERLTRVITNIVGNAIKFTPPGGTIDVRAREEGDVVRFTITDSGPGIPKDALPHLFERHWQQRKRARGEGLGLGLYIAKSIVELHGGEIDVDSTPGEGTTFTFTIPKVIMGAEMGHAIRT
jgi:signal transduction histidine kinase